MTTIRFVGLILLIFLGGLGASYWLNRSRVNADLTDFAPARRDDHNPSWDLLSRARALAKGRQKDVLDGDAAAALKSGDYEKVLAVLDKAIKEDPKDAFLYACRGVCYVGQKDYTQALRDFDEAIRLEADDGFFYLQRGNVHREKKDFDRALADHSEAIRLGPNEATGYVARGLDYEKQGSYDDALADYERGIRAAENDPTAYYQLALFLAACPRAELRDGERAVDQAKRGRELSEGNEPAYLEALAAGHAEVGRYGEAVETQTKLIQSFTPEDDPQEIAQAKARLKLYEQRKPYRLEK